MLKASRIFVITYHYKRSWAALATKTGLAKRHLRLSIVVWLFHSQMRERMGHCNGGRRARLMVVEHNVVQILELAKDWVHFRRLKPRGLSQLVDSRRAAFSQVELEELVASIASGVVHLAWLTDLESIREKASPNDDT